MTEQITFSVITLPIIRNGEEKNTNSIALAEKFRELRLRSLQKAPDAFARKYEDEIQCGLDHSLSRLSNAKAVHFVGLKRPDSSSSLMKDPQANEAMLNGEWLGLIVLLGPQDDSEHSDLYPNKDPFQRMTAADREDRLLSSQAQLVSSAALHYHLNGMFVDPIARGSGLGLALIRAALGRAKEQAATFNAGIRITICVYDHNKAAWKLYEKAGFKVVSNKRPSLTRGPEFTAVDMELKIAAAT